MNKVDVRKLKIDSLVSLVARNDYATAKFLRVKLYKEEWHELIAKGKITEAQATKCMSEGMLKEGEMPVKETRVYNRFAEAAENVKALGEKFERELKTFLEGKQADLETLKNAGFTFRPQWRNAAMEGSRKNAKTVLT